MEAWKRPLLPWFLGCSQIAARQNPKLPYSCVLLDSKQILNLREKEVKNLSKVILNFTSKQQRRTKIWRAKRLPDPTVSPPPQKKILRHWFSESTTESIANFLNELDRQNVKEKNNCKTKKLITHLSLLGTSAALHESSQQETGIMTREKKGDGKTPKKKLNPEHF